MRFSVRVATVPGVEIKPLNGYCLRRWPCTTALSATDRSQCASGIASEMLRFAGEGSNCPTVAALPVGRNRAVFVARDGCLIAGEVRFRTCPAPP